MRWHCAVLVAACVATAVTATMKVRVSSFATHNCSGQPNGIATYVSGACGFGGVVHTCYSGVTCLRVRTYGSQDGAMTHTEHGYHATKLMRRASSTTAMRNTTNLAAEPSTPAPTCSPDYTAQSAWPCGLGFCGVDGLDTRVVSCDFAQPVTQSCGQYCIDGCEDITRWRKGCVSGSMDVAAVPCDGVTVIGYANAMSCTPPETQTQGFAAGICLSGTRYDCVDEP